MHVHIVNHTGLGYQCGSCRETATRMVRCRIGGEILARCSSCGANMERMRDAHEQTVTRTGSGCAVPRRVG